ncbi:MAG: glycosyltransferase family 2 protein [Planctomycetes bacterium]|nr:glycosyltransferase family 2 protein [Planctomycetota bacterium]
MNVVTLLPAYNEKAAVARVVSAVRLHHLPVIVVDDCSSDDTSSLARGAGARVVCHDVNRGKGQAVLTGVAEARRLGYSHTLVMDADGQHDPGEIPLFLDAAPAADIVLGSRMRNPAGMPLLRLATNRSMSTLISWIAHHRITDTQSGYRLVSMDVWDCVPVFSARFDMESEFLITACRAGFTLAEVPISTIYGDEKSKINPFVDTYRFFRLLFRLLLRKPWVAARRSLLEKRPDSF